MQVLLNQIDGRLMTGGDVQPLLDDQESATRREVAAAYPTLQRFLDRTATIPLSEKHHGATGARRFRHDPTYIIRGLTDLHLEFTLAA